MIIKIINDKESWDAFVAAQPFSQFAQSWEWAVLQSERVGKVWRLAVLENDKILAVAKIVKKPLLLGRSYLYCDRGPIFRDNLWQAEIDCLLIEEIGKIAVREKAIFLRLDPIFDLDIKKAGFVKTIDIQPKKTAILDLSIASADLLKTMHQKTRYNIRLAEKRGVEIRAVGLEKFEEFWRLMEATRERDDFNLHGRKYYQEMIGLPFVILYFAYFKDKVIAASITSHFGDMATYIHGGSANDDREVMAPYLLQWTAILEAQKRGLRYYDFYGVDEAKWPGVTRFKMGFNPKVYEYVGTVDLVFNKVWYSVYKVLRILRRKL